MIQQPNVPLVDVDVDPALFSVDGLIQILEDHVAPFGVSLLLAVLTFVIGRWGARLVTRIIGRLLRRVHTEESLVKFISDLVYALLLAIVVIAALERVGVRTTAAVAIIGAAGLAVGLALQGSLGNFASGVLIMVFRPYRVGDTVLIAGKLGIVESVHIFHTVLYTSDMRKVIIPNGAITSTSIENHSALSTRRVELVFTIDFGGDLQSSRGELERVAGEESRALGEPALEVSLVELAEGKVTFAVHVSVKAEDFAAVRSDLLERVKQQFGERLMAAKAT